MKVSTEFVAACYGHRTVSESMSAVRQRIWASKVGKSPSIAPKLCSIPPTTEAFKENVKRAHLQTCIWKGALDLEAPYLDPVLFGWEKVEKNMISQSSYVTKQYFASTNGSSANDKMCL